MNTMHKAAGAAAAAVLALGLAACSSDSGSSGSSSSGSSAEGPRISLLLPESKTARYEAQDRPNFEAKVAELCPECKVEYGNADQDEAKQQQQAEAAITNGAKVMVLDAVNVQSAANIVNEANQKKIPVISYGRLVADSDLAYYVSIDPYKVGQQQAQSLVAATTAAGVAKPRVVMINGSPTDSNSGPYKKGAHSVLDGSTTVVKEYDTPDWSPDKAQAEMDQAITAVGKDGFDAVYVANDGMAGGVIASLKNAGIDPSKRAVTGQDAEVAGLQRILAGDQLMTVYQPIKQIAETSAELAVALAKGQSPTVDTTATVDNGKEKVPSVLLDTIAVTKDNMKDTVIADGFVTAAQLCTPQYKAACEAAGIS